MDNKLYWVGNAAKTKIIRGILAEATTDKEWLIFDYGCGRGGDWPTVLRDNPHLRLVGYEPYGKSYDVASKSLLGLNAEVFSGSALEQMNFRADFIVSFSVLEHVYDRRFYLETAKRLLAPEGTFILNYDDGHFRNLLNLNCPHLWFGQMKEWIHNLIADPLSWAGIVTHYQRRVSRRELEDMVRETGFQIVRSEYSNLASFKELQKNIPGPLQQEFSLLWLTVEEQLNSRFLQEQLEMLDDSANLWLQMGSKTLYLKSNRERKD